MMTQVKHVFEKKSDIDISPHSANLLLNIYMSGWTHPINLNQYRYPTCFLKPEGYSDDNLEYLLQNNLVSVQSKTIDNICWKNMVLEIDGNYINKKDQVIEHFKDLIKDKNLDDPGSEEIFSNLYYIELTQKGIKTTQELEKFYKCIAEDTAAKPRKNRRVDKYRRCYGAVKKRGVNITIGTVDELEIIPKIFKEPYDLTDLFTASDHKFIGYFGEKDTSNIDILRTRLCLKNRL